MRPKKELGMVLIFLGLFVGYALLEASQRGLAATFANPVFLGQANLLNLTRSIGLFGIFSVAMGTVIITGGIDLSVGSMFALLGVILAYLLGPDNIPWPSGGWAHHIARDADRPVSRTPGFPRAPPALRGDLVWSACLSRARPVYFVGPNGRVRQQHWF